MKKLIILFISLMVGLLLISGCVPKEEEIKQKQERKIVINNLFTNMIENKDSAFLDVEKYSGMDENKKYLLGNEIACYSYQYMKYSIDKEEKSYRKIAVNYNNYGSIKTALLVSSLVDSSYDLYEHILNVMDKKKTNFSSLRMEKENQLIERALEFIKLKKEDWFKEVDSAE